MSNESILIGKIRELQAVETLEYENKNWLQEGTEPARLSEQKQALIGTILREARALEMDRNQLSKACAAFSER